MSPVRALGGNLWAMEVDEAFRKWADDLARYASAIVGPDDARDVVAETFAQLLVSPRWSTVRDHRAYLFGAVLNVARELRRGETRRTAREWRAASLPGTVELLADPTVRDAVSRLSLQQRAIVHLTYWEGHSPSEVARALGVTEGTVRRQLARARARLRKVLTHD